MKLFSIWIFNMCLARYTYLYVVMNMDAELEELGVDVVTIPGA